jgi:DNA-binding HxlR family transcriptional regulator
MRSGSFGLSLLADQLDVNVIQALAKGPYELPELRRTLRSPPPTTLRSHLKELARLGIVHREQTSGFTKAVSHELTPAGGDLLKAADMLAGWLAGAPDEQVTLGSPASKNILQALLAGWNSAIVRALAAKPRSLTELDRLITGVNYPALDRRLAAMRDARQITAVSSSGGATKYSLTRWTREAAIPLLALASWEDRYPPHDAEQLSPVDIEGIFLLVTPLLNLPFSLRGTCQLAIDISKGPNLRRSGVVVCVEPGNPVVCRSDRRITVPTRASGSATAWTGVLGYGCGIGIELDGDRDLAKGLLAGMRVALASRPDSVHAD